MRLFYFMKSFVPFRILVYGLAEEVSPYFFIEIEIYERKGKYIFGETAKRRIFTECSLPQEIERTRVHYIRAV